MQGNNSGWLTSTFPYMQVISISSISLCNSKICCFQFFLHFSSQQEGASAEGSHFVTNNPQLLRRNFRKSFFISANTYDKYFLYKFYGIAHHDNKTCSLPACKYHIILLSEIEEFLHKLDTFCFTYQHVDCLYTLFN